MINFEKPFGKKEVGLTPERENFLTNEYLNKKYLVPDSINEKLKDLSKILSEKYPDFFNSIAIVGGIANGSYELRTREEKNPATDLDYHLIVKNSPDQKTLNLISEDIRKFVADIDLIPDPELNGKNSKNLLDISKIEEHIGKEEYDLLSLAFNCNYGDSKEAQQILIRKILERSDRQKIWDQICEYHDQSLSLHHGRWSDEFNSLILNKYFPEKVKKFSLPKNPRDLL